MLIVKDRLFHRSYLKNMSDNIRTLSFPQVKRVGLHSLVEWNPSFPERFRTSRNDNSAMNNVFLQKTGIFEIDSNSLLMENS